MPTWCTFSVDSQEIGIEWIGGYGSGKLCSYPLEVFVSGMLRWMRPTVKSNAKLYPNRNNPTVLVLDWEIVF